MEKKKTCKVDGVVYVESDRDEDAISLCSGCVAQHDDKLCNNLGACYVPDLEPDDFIWVKKNED